MEAALRTVSSSESHSVGITHDGHALTWTQPGKHERGSRFGQLCRGRGKIGRADAERPGEVPHPHDKLWVAGWAGGRKDSGHTALLDDDGDLWMCGCDRWQQLGLGSGDAGAAGYTWSRVWQNRPQRLLHLKNVKAGIRDCGLGADHTLLLSSNERDVYSWGRGQQGQLGRGGRKPFVSAPQRSEELSAAADSCTPIRAVCATGNCSASIGGDGRVLATVGRCTDLSAALTACVEDARKRGLLDKPAALG
jgi:alpha-tubulin suppressor-like RCC1 family protein